jgi:excinuclease ABC subunit C
MEHPDEQPKAVLSETIRNLPEKAGVYQYFDSAGKIIYVGKAKNLKKRVGSYFNRDAHTDRKTRVLVKNIASLKYLVVETELDALLLENNLIKEHQPRYNVLLKDDKTYPWICIKNEPFPRVFPTRKLVNDGSQYFGPYASGKMMHTLLDLIRQLFHVRTCSLALNDNSIEKGKFKICLEYHIGNCKGPCEGLQSRIDYEAQIQSIKQIIKGNISSIIRQLKEEMHRLATDYKFEEAHRIKTRIEILENYQSKSTVVSSAIAEADVFNILTDEDEIAFVNYLKIVNGAIVQGQTVEMKSRLGESKEELLAYAIVELRQRFQSESREIILPFGLELPLPETELIVPQRGDKRKLLELSMQNVEAYKKERQRKLDLVDPERHTKRVLQQMMKDLRLPTEPRHIECFDNSNIQGAFPVSAMTVFKDLKPSKKDYRHFNIKTVEGPNDFASMEEVIYRRYKRMIEENQPIPDLIVIDGGKGQLSSALDSLEKLSLRGKIPIVGIAKRLEEIYYPGDSLPLYIDKKSETLRVLQHIRDEAHRFGITHHRNKRSKATIRTQLLNIPGIGESLATSLLKHFKSVKKISEASEAEIAEVVGEAKARKVYEHYRSAS